MFMAFIIGFSFANWMAIGLFVPNEGFPLCTGVKFDVGIAVVSSTFFDLLLQHQQYTRHEIERITTSAPAPIAPKMAADNEDDDVVEVGVDEEIVADALTDE